MKKFYIRLPLGPFARLVNNARRESVTRETRVAPVSIKFFLADTVATE
jgi:hypothetical protein